MLLQRWEIDCGRLNKSWRVASDKSYMVAGTNPHLPSSEQTEEAPTAFPPWIQNKISITNTRVGRCLVCCRLHLVKQIGDKNSSAWNWNLASVYSRGCWHLGGWPGHWLSFIQEQNILGIWIVSINPSQNFEILFSITQGLKCGDGTRCQKTTPDFVEEETRPVISCFGFWRLPNEGTFAF